MKRDRSIGKVAILSTGFVLLASVAMAAVVVVLTAYGIGRGLAWFLPFSVFEATLLALLAFIAVTGALWRVVENISRPRTWHPRWTGADENLVEEDEGWEEGEDAPAEMRTSQPEVVSSPSLPEPTLGRP